MPSSNSVEAHLTIPNRPKLKEWTGIWGHQNRRGPFFVQGFVDGRGEMSEAWSKGTGSWWAKKPTLSSTDDPNSKPTPRPSRSIVNWAVFQHGESQVQPWWACPSQVVGEIWGGGGLPQAHACSFGLEISGPGQNCEFGNVVSWTFRILAPGSPQSPVSVLLNVRWSLPTLPQVPFKTAYSQKRFEIQVKLNISFSQLPASFLGTKTLSCWPLRFLQHLL